MPVVGGNARQDRLNQMQRHAKRPALLGQNKKAITIVEVYDSDVLSQDGVPDELVGKILQEPGTLWAKVRFNKGGREAYCAFQASEAEILSTHGNSVLLEGLQGTITYNGIRPEAGRIVLRGEASRSLRGTGETNVLDISGIL
jgi:hypothetical protein